MASDNVAKEFAETVYKTFEALRARNMEPNEACAMAVRIGAGAATLPPSLNELAAAVRTASPSEPDTMRQLREKVVQAFGSLDAVQAAFWPSNPESDSAIIAAQAADGPEPLQTGSQGTSHGGGGIGFSGKKLKGSDFTYFIHHSDLAVDMGLVSLMYSELMRLRDDSIVTALEAAAASLASEIASAHSSSDGGDGSGGGADHGALGPSANNGMPGGVGSFFAGDGIFGGGGGGAAGSAPAAVALASQPGPGVCASPAALCRCVAVALANPALEDPGGHEALERLAKAVGAWPVGQKELLLRVLESWGPRDMGRAVSTCQQHVTLTLYTRMAVTPGVEAVVALLGLMSEACGRSGALEFSEFYNGAVNAEDFNIQEDFRRWKLPHRYGFSFCRHPFIYDPAAKARVLQLENQIAQFQQFESSMMQAMLGGSSMPYLVLRVRRGPHLLRDTLLQINRAKDRAELRKPLKVQFIGEEGVDEGGVQKEFFQLLVRQAFNPDFGMFVYDEARRLHWFRASGLDMDMEYELIGILIGLAIYNSHILEFQFPMVLYKKLMGHDLGLEDLQELHPEVHQSLIKLLHMSPREVEELGLAFEVETEVGFGEMETVALKPGGGGAPVTWSNKEEYARLYALHLLDGSVARQFGAFRRGFLRLCSGDALQMFRPVELEQLVCGGRTLDLEALQAATHYDDGYSASAPVIRWFWEVAHSLDEPQRKRLLFFITGSDRVPIKGLAHLTPPFVISPNGGHSDRLPTAHTCFNHLLLPAYKDRETLRARLLLAIENAEGFGLM